jgi:hypothetical protein
VSCRRVSIGLRTLGRRSATAAALVLVLAAAAGCGSTSHGSRASAGRRSFRNGFLVFGYPAGWKPFVFDVTGTLHFSPMVYVSSQPAHSPCHTAASVTTCGWPLKRLRPGGALVVWENRGAPGWSLRSTSGTAVRIGGRRAKRTVTKPGPCGAIGADETIAVEIERPLPDNWTSFTACLRGPGLAEGERAVDAVLASTRFVAR